MKQLFFLAAGMFAIGCDNYIVAGLLPGIGATLDASVAAVGQGITVFDLTYVISAPVFAVLLARKSSRLILTAALTLFTLGNVLTLLTDSLGVYLFSRGVVGIGAGLYIPVAVAAATELSQPSARGRALSLAWGANSAGAVVGVPAGLWVAGEFGWRAAVIQILVLAMLAFAGAVASQPALRVTRPPSLTEQLRLLTDRRVLSVIGIMLITATASLGLYTYVAPLLAGTTNSVTAALSMWNIGGLIGSIAIGHLVDRTHRPEWVMAAILAALMAATFVLPAVHKIFIIGLLPYLIWGAMGWATVMPQQHILIGIQPSSGATLVALNSAAVGLGSALGSAGGGIAIAFGLDAGKLPYAAAGLLLCALVAQLCVIRTSEEDMVCPVQ